MANILRSKTADPAIFRPFFPPSKHHGGEPPSVDKIIAALKLENHPLGGYYAAVDRSPFLIEPPGREGTLQKNDKPVYRSLYSSIMHMMTAKSPNISFHYNLGTAIHTLHHGRARYAVIRMDLERDADGFQPIETIDVGPNIDKGEKLQWTVAGGNWKVGWVLPDSDRTEDVSDSKMLISEVKTPITWIFSMV